MALSGGQTTQHALYGAMQRRYGSFAGKAAVAPEPAPVATGPHSSGGRWVQPNRRTLRAEDRRWEEREERVPEARAQPPSTPTGEPAILATAKLTPAQAEEELVLQAALVLLELLD